MKTRVITLSVFMLSLLMVAANPKISDKSEDNVAVEMETEDFNSIEINGVFNVILKKGDPKLVVEAPQKVIDNLKIENNGGKLRLGYSKDLKLKKHETINLLISYKSLKALEINSVGVLKTDKAILANDFDLDISGVGKIEVEIECSNLNADISGVGEIILIGKAETAKIDHSGVGALKAFGLKTDYLNLDQSGVGEVQVYVNKKLDIDASGIGAVKARGPGNIGKKDISGLTVFKWE